MYADITKLNGRIITKEFIGFDIETYSDKNIFRMGSFVFNDYSRTFFNKRDMIEYMFNNPRIFQGKLIVATNLQFDIIGLFFGEAEFSKLSMLWNKSRLISVKIKFEDSKKHGDIIFIDTLNYNVSSVQNLGRLVNIKKIEIDPILFSKEKLTREENKLMKEYNINDALISKKYMEFFQKILNDLGGNCKLTISSCAFDLYRRKYLPIELFKEEKILHDKEITDWIFKSYYGGRTEVFRKGPFDNTFYYDVNSLYPTVMLNNCFPIPQSVAIPKELSIENIENFMGVTECLIEAPKIHIPILPLRIDEKLIFPIGIFRGVWSNEILKYAIENGYKIREIYKQIIYRDKIKLFFNYVQDLYSLRIMLKNCGDPTEQTIKLFLNSLYGKFSQKKHAKYEILAIEDMTSQKLKHYIDNGFDVDESGDGAFFIISKEGKNYPKNTFPIIASYVTSYALIYMHKLYLEYPPLYTDTDSIICDKPILDHDLLGSELGKLKCEKTGEVEIYSPKCYAFNKIPTVKGIYFNKTLDDNDRYKMFKEYVSGEPIEQSNFIKFKASLRRTKDIFPNQKIIFIKKLSQKNHDKRIFEKDGSSNPIELKNEVIENGNKNN